MTFHVKTNLKSIFIYSKITGKPFVAKKDLFNYGYNLSSKKSDILIEIIVIRQLFHTNIFLKMTC